MVTGQMLDTLGEGKALSQNELERIHHDKTGALIEASILMGAMCANADTDTLAQLERLAWCVGLGFQVQDDVLDVTQSSATLGKNAGSDEKLDKSTYVKLLGTANALDYADRLFCEALTLANSLEAKQLADMIGILQRRQH